jgi:hypothetical protein
MHHEDALAVPLDHVERRGNRLGGAHGALRGPQQHAKRARRLRAPEDVTRLQRKVLRELVAQAARDTGELDRVDAALVHVDDQVAVGLVEARRHLGE